MTGWRWRRHVSGRGVVRDSGGDLSFPLSSFPPGGQMCYPVFPRIPCLLPHLPSSPLAGLRGRTWPRLSDLGSFGDRGLASVSSRSPSASPWAPAGTCPSPLLPSPPISALPPLLASPILATPVLRPPPSASGLISVSFALYCSLTGIIKIRINREVSISLPVSSSSSSCLSDWLCLRLSHSLWLSLSLSLSSFPSTRAPNANRPLQQLGQGPPRAEDST